MDTQLTNAQTKYLNTIPEENIWLANYTSSQTKSTYKMAVSQFIKHFELANVHELRDIGQAHLIAWRDHLINEGMSSRSINNRMSALSSLFNHLCEKQLIATNPVKGLKRPKVDQRKVKTPPLTVNQVRQMLDAPDTSKLIGLRDRAILSTLFYSGCREGALVKLTIADFYERSGYYVLDLNEKGGTQNTVAIHHELQADLRRFLAVAPHAHDKTAPMFISTRQFKEQHRPMDTRSIRFLFKKYLNIIGIANPERYSVHSARATLITEALRSGAKVENVQQTVSHANVSTTLMYDQRHQEPKNSASFNVNY